MKRAFKPLCQHTIPDAGEPTRVAYVMLCRRPARHGGKHRVEFKDGRFKEWNTGEVRSYLEYGL